MTGHRDPRRGWWWLLVTMLTVVPTRAHADALIPYMAVPWGQVFLLPLVVAVEAAVLRGTLGGKVVSAIGQSLIANLASTLVGVGLYCVTMPWFGERLFSWWVKGGGTEAIRTAGIALGFASVLWLVSWLVESAIVARLRRTDRTTDVRRSCAIANGVTYAGLVALAVWLEA